MLDSLIESRHARDGRSAFGGGAASVLVHSTLVAVAVYSTLHAGLPREQLRVVGRIELPAVPGAPRRPAQNLVGLPLPPRPLRLAVSPVVPPVIPPPSSEPFDPGRFSGIDSDSGLLPGLRAPGPATPSSPVYAATVVEERPERIGGPEPRYPEILRQAGIEGQVVVECVIDTLGRAERGSIRVLSSTHVLFEAPAREAVAASVFRPARLDGRPVRVRVQLPLTFRMAHAGRGGP